MIVCKDSKGYIQVPCVWLVLQACPIAVIKKKSSEYRWFLASYFQRANVQSRGSLQRIFHHERSSSFYPLTLIVKRPFQLHQLACPVRDNILCVRRLEMAPDTIKMAETIIVIPCCAGKSRQPNSTIPFCYVHTKLQSFSNWRDHNRKLESVCPRYKMPEKHNGNANLLQFTPKWPLEKSIPQLQSSLEQHTDY